MFVTSAYAQAQGGLPVSDPLVSFFLPMVLVFGIFYFLVIRPQQKKIKSHQEKIVNAKKGDKVITAGGIEGIIVHVREDIYEVEIAPNVRVKIIKNTLADVIEKK